MNSPEFGPPLTPVPVADMDAETRARIALAADTLSERMRVRPNPSTDYDTRRNVEELLVALGYHECAVHDLTRPNHNY